MKQTFVNLLLMEKRFRLQETIPPKNFSVGMPITESFLTGTCKLKLFLTLFLFDWSTCTRRHSVEEKLDFWKNKRKSA